MLSQILHIHQVEERLNFLNHFNTSHLWHLEFSDQEVNCALTLLINRVRHDEIYSCQATCEEFDLTLVAKFK